MKYILILSMLMFGCAYRSSDSPAKTDQTTIDVRIPADSRFRVGDCFVLKELKDLEMKVFLVADSGYFILYINSDTHNLEWSPISNEEVVTYKGIKSKCSRRLK